MKAHETLQNYAYDLTGLDIDIHKIGPRQGPALQSGKIRTIPRIDPAHESWGRVQQALARPRQEGNIGFILIQPAKGSENDSGSLETYHFPWGGYTDNPVGTNEMAAYAAAHPDWPILAVDSPAVGSSRRLPSAVSREIGRTGSYMPYGEVAIAALERILIDYDTHIFSGASQGARRAIAAVACMGESLGRKTAELHLVDPVGSHEQSFADLAKAFMRREAIHTRRYTQASSDVLGAGAQSTLGSPSRLPVLLGNFIRRGGFLNQFVREPQAMARSGLKADLLRASPHVTDALTVSSPSDSELTSPRDVQEILESLAEGSHLHESHLGIEHRILKRQTHALIAGHPGALGVLLSRQLPVSSV